MKTTLLRCACAALLGLGTVSTCLADSFVSSASSAGSASVGSLSDSIHDSSNSSSKDKKVADGDYDVIEVAALPEHPGMLRLRLQAHVGPADADAGAFMLDLPRKALGEQALAQGDIVSVHNRAYGLEFARARTQEAFFLVLADDWRSDLEARPVVF